MLKSLLLNIQTSARHVKCTHAHPVSLSRWLGRNMFNRKLLRLVDPSIFPSDIGYTEYYKYKPQQ